ncbi:MAG TPA: AsmA-like C-terminal region-containing protein [Terriglobales bacterium]|jgi:hypothetical protein
MAVNVEEKQFAASPAQVRHKPRRRIAIILVVLLACLVVAGVTASHKWPFTRDAILQALQQQAGGEVRIGSFHQMYLPKPGCIAENVTFRHAGDKTGQPFLTIQTLKVVGTYHGLLTNHIALIRADGLHITIAPAPPSTAGTPGPFNVGRLMSGLTIGKLIANGASIEFAPTPERKQALIFRIPKLIVHDLENGKPLQFQASLQVPQPPIDLAAEGEFGPWNAGHGGESKASGAYTLNSLDLGAFHDIGGIVTSKGNFDGTLQHITVHGTADTPNFTVSTSGHKIHMAGEFDAKVNGLNGDVEVDALRVHYGRTTIVGAGSVEGKDGQDGKTAAFELASRQARVQDLLWMFISESKPPMTGPITFRTKATLAPGTAPFLDRVKLVGDFGISNGQYPDPDTQKNIDVLSARARGQADKVEDTNEKLGSDSYDPGQVLSDVKGHVVLTNAVAHLSDVSFQIPGALAKLSGTYKLTTEQIDLHGYMRLDSELSKATTGVKSVLLKIAQPFMKKGKHKASVVALQIGGTYHNPTYTAVPKAEK